MSENRRSRKSRQCPWQAGRFPVTTKCLCREATPVLWLGVRLRHGALGQLGRVVLQDRDDGRCQLSCEVTGEPADPMTAERRRIFEPLGLELARRVEATAGPAPESAAADPPPRPAEPEELIENKLIPCGRCRTMVAMLIFAPEATDPGRLEDCARKMYRDYMTAVGQNLLTTVKAYGDPAGRLKIGDASQRRGGLVWLRQGIPT